MAFKLGEAPGHIWIGVSDLAKKGNFVWSPTAEPFTYTSWAYSKSRPGYTRRCVQQHHQDGIIGWVVQDCFHILWVVCETLD